MKDFVKRIAVTGGAGQIAYSLLFRIANGDLLGRDQPIALHLLEVPEALKFLDGVRMELDDCAFPLLREIRIGSSPQEIFDGVDYALLIGAKPRSAGLERADLLLDNAKIFVDHGKALNDVATSQVKVLVIGNPCNTNCLIAMHHAPKIPKKNFHAMTRLDQNRAQSFLARKAETDILKVSHVTIWGNHSATQVPDFVNALIDGKPVESVIRDRKWLEEEFINSVQKRGATIIAARGKSSAASAAQAILDSVRSLVIPTSKENWFSTGIWSEGNPFRIAEDLVFSFPCRTLENGDYSIVKDVVLNEFLHSKIKASEKELLEERDLVKSMLK